MIMWNCLFGWAIRPLLRAIPAHARNDPSAWTGPSGWKTRQYASNRSGTTDPVSWLNGCSRGPSQLAAVASLAHSIRSSVAT